MDRRWKTASATTIVPALPLLGFSQVESGLKRSKGQDAVDYEQGEERVVKDVGNSNSVVSLPVVNGVQHGEANEQMVPLSKQHRPSVEIPKQHWRRKKLKPIEFGATMEKDGDYLRLQSSSSGTGGYGGGGGAVRFGDMEMDEDVQQEGIKFNNTTRVIQKTVANPAADTDAGRERTELLSNDVQGWGRPSTDSSTINTSHQQRQRLSLQSSSETRYHPPHHPSLMTPPPTAMLRAFHQNTPPYHPVENRNFAVNYGGLDGMPYSTPVPAFFPHNPEGYGGMLPPLPQHNQERRQQPPSHPHHKPTDSISSSIDEEGGGFQYPPQPLPAPHPSQMLQFPPPPFRHSPPYLQQYSHLPPQYHTNGYPNSVDSGPPNTNGSIHHSHSVAHFRHSQPPYQELQASSSSDHSQSSSSGHISPFPPPHLPYPPSYQQQIPHHAPPRGSPLCQQVVGSQAMLQTQVVAGHGPPTGLGYGNHSINERSMTDYVLHQYGESLFADLRLDLVFSSPSAGEMDYHRVNIPFHSLIAGRVGVLADMLSKREWDGLSGKDRLVKVSLDDMVQYGEQDIGENVKRTIRNLRNFLTGTAVIVALAWAYGCSEKMMGEWFEMDAKGELRELILTMQHNLEPQSEDHECSKMEPLLSSTTEEVARLHRSTAPSPEPKEAPKTTEQNKPPPPPPQRDWADDFEDDTEEEYGKDELELERQLSHSDTEATTPHHEASPRKPFAEIDYTPHWSPALIPSQDNSLKRILSVLIAAVLLDIPSLVDFCGGRLAAHIHSLRDPSLGLETLSLILGKGAYVSPPSFAAAKKFEYVNALVYDIFSTALREMINRSVNQLIHGEELELIALKELPFETVVGNALEIVNGLPLSSTIEKRRVMQKLVTKARTEKGVVVAVSLGVASAVTMAERRNVMRFGDIQGPEVGGKIVVGKIVRKKWVWLEGY